MTRLFSTGVSGTIGKHLPKDVIPIRVNLATKDRLIRKIELDNDSNLIHLAGIVGPSEVLKDIKYARAVNIDGTENLVTGFLDKSQGNFYYISTSHVYRFSSTPISESSLVGPTNIYAEQKLETELLLQKIFKPFPERLTIIRVFSVLDWDVAPYTLGGAIRKLTHTHSDFILANASDVRDFLTPKTIAQTIYEIAAKGTQFGVVNLCSGTGISVGNAAKIMLIGSKFEIPESKFSWVQSANPYIVGDNTRLLSRHPSLQLTWKPSKLS